MPSGDLVSIGDVERAADRIGSSVVRTPLLLMESGDAGRPIWLKAESLQRDGSFKLRGALNAMLSMDAGALRHGVVTHSSGNHAQAVARAAQTLGVQATVVMPRDAPAVKRAGTERLGASVVLVDAADRVPVAERIRVETGAAFLPPFDHADVIAGQGTVGLEIVDMLREPATVYVPVSGGGLISGIAVAVKAKSPESRVVAVEPELAGDLAEGWAAGEHIGWDAARTSRTLADGLRVPSVGDLNWRHIAELVDDVVTVSEDEIVAAMRRIVLDAKLVCEPSGAVALAGCLAARDERGAPATAVAVVSGGNVDPAQLARIIGGSAG